MLFSSGGASSYSWVPQIFCRGLASLYQSFSARLSASKNVLRKLIDKVKKLIDQVSKLIDLVRNFIVFVP